MTPESQTADERIFTDEHIGMELFWEKNKSRILLGLAAIVVLALATGVWFWRQHTIAQDAQRAFALAAGPDAWKEIISKYPDTTPAISSSLMLAESLRESGDLPASTETYESLLARLPKAHPLEGLALLGLAENASASGDQKLAVERLKAAGASSSAYAAELALLLEARELAESGKVGEARRVYESVAAEFPESLAARIARSQAEQLSVVDPGTAQ